MNIYFSFFVISGSLSQVFSTVVWENRTVDCSDGWESCTLIKKGGLPIRQNIFHCRTEPVPHKPGKPYLWVRPQDKVRKACALDCPPHPTVNLSVTFKKPYTGSGCAKFATYGYYKEDNEWYMWVTGKCKAYLTMWCPYDDL